MLFLTLRWGNWPFRNWRMQNYRLQLALSGNSITQKCLRESLLITTVVEQKIIQNYNDPMHHLRWNNAGKIDRKILHLLAISKNVLYFCRHIIWSNDMKPNYSVFAIIALTLEIAASCIFSSNGRLDSFSFNSIMTQSSHSDTTYVVIAGDLDTYSQIKSNKRSIFSEIKHNKPY